MAPDLGLVLGFAGVGLLVVSARLNLVSRRQRRACKLYLDRCRQKARQVDRAVQGSINHLTLVIGRRIRRRQGRRLDALDRRLRELAEDVAHLQRQAYYDYEAEQAAEASSVYDDPAVLALRAGEVRRADTP